MSHTGIEPLSNHACFILWVRLMKNIQTSSINIGTLGWGALVMSEPSFVKMWHVESGRGAKIILRNQLFRESLNNQGDVVLPQAGRHIYIHISMRGTWMDKDRYLKNKQPIIRYTDARTLKSMNIYAHTWIDRCMYRYPRSENDR